MPDFNATFPNESPANRPRSAFPLWLLAAIGGAVLLLFFTRMPGSEQKGIGEKFAGWQLQPLTGDPRPLSSADAQGRVALLNFWGTWCPPCRAEFPHIAEMAHHFSRNPEFVLAAVSCGGGGDDSELEPLREETAQFLEKSKSDLPTYADQNGAARKILSGVIDFDGYPTTVVLDRDGIVRGVWVGYSPGTERQMERLVDELLAAGPKTEK